MSKKRSMLVLLRACFALTVLLGVGLFATPAFAESLGVSGVDHFFDPNATETAVDVLTVTGKTGDTVYINMAKGDQVIASHLAFTLDDKTAEVDNNGDMVGVVSVEFNAQAFSYYDTYSLEVYADRGESQRLYAGTVFTVWAQYGAKSEPLVVRTLANEEERPLAVPQTQEYSSETYQLVGNEPQDANGRQVYVYETSTDLADSTDAHIAYYDVANPTGDPLKTEVITLAKGTSQNVAIESVIAGNDGGFYRTLQLSNSVALAYPGVTERSIMCKKLSSDWNKVGSFFTAHIRFVDESGNELGVAADTVVVNKKYVYTAPSRLYVNTDGTVKEYQVQSRTQAVVRLEPGQEEGDATYDIVYEPVTDKAERTWTIVLQNGSVSPKDSNRVIKRITYKGRPGDSAVHTTQQRITVDGKDFVPIAAAAESYTHTFGVGSMDVEQVIYYVPDGYVAPQAYDVTVKYVNIATNEVIGTESYTASPSMRADLQITSPASFSQGGVEWVRLNGQESPIRHGFYAGAREYVVYYRDVNDDLHTNTIIRTVRVVYVDEEGNTITRPTIVVNNGTTTSEGGAEATNDADATGTGLATDGDLLSITGEDGDVLVADDGTDLTTMRIEDDETPLAGPEAEEGAAKVSTEAMVIGGVAAAVAAGLILFFVHRRRKQGVGE